MPTPRLPQSPQELEGWSSRFFEAIHTESDRGCVLVAAAFLDEALELLLRSRMVSEGAVVKQSVDPLFVGAIAPLKSFWAKAELARALGLLIPREHADLGRIRNLRNHFAHSYSEANVSSEKARSIVADLWHFGTKTYPTPATGVADPAELRRRFELGSAWIAGLLHNRAGMAVPKGGASAENPDDC